MLRRILVLLVGLFLKKIENNFSSKGERSLLGGPGGAGAWRDHTSSLVGFRRLAEMGELAVAKTRGAPAGRSPRGGSVAGGTATVAHGGTERGLSLGYCPREDGVCGWCDTLSLCQALLSPAFLGRSWPDAI